MGVWLCIGGGMLTLLLAAISSKKKGICGDYIIRLNGPGSHFFISEQEVADLLKQSCRCNLKGQPVESFNLHEMEEMLKKNTWISGAELFFDNRNILHVNVTEKEPVARIFTTDGQSFYIDNSGNKMPLSEKLSAKVPVFTGFPGRKKMTAADSMLLDGLRYTALYIRSDSFWMAQVAQVDISPDGNLEMIPVVGNHLVKLGPAENIPAKFRRLMIFYQQVLSKTGMEKYKVINVQYRGQVVVSRYAGDPKVDSLQLRKNVEKLLKQSFEAASDTTVRILPPVQQLEPDSATMKGESLPDEKSKSPEPNNPNPGLKKKAPSAPNPADGQADTRRDASDKAAPEKKKNIKKVKASEENKKEETRKPKAVMPKKTGEEENGGYN